MHRYRHSTSEAGHCATTALPRLLEVTQSVCYTTDFLIVLLSFEDHWVPRRRSVAIENRKHDSPNQVRRTHLRAGIGPAQLRMALLVRPTPSALMPGAYQTWRTRAVVGT